MENKPVQSGRPERIRQSNIELLRIVAACGVIILHWNNPHIGGAFRFTPGGSPNQIILTALEVTFICAVNLYVLISGYFMRDTRRSDLMKPVTLLAQYLVFELLFLLVRELPRGGITFDTVLSYYSPHYWFVFVYVALYLAAPYVNSVWRRLKSRDKTILLAVLLGVFAVYPMALDMIGYITENTMQGLHTVGLDGAQAGYTIVNFILVYLIGCALRDREERPAVRELKQWQTLLLLLANILALLVWTWVERQVFPRDSELVPAWNYNNPLVITEAVLFFLLFRRMKIKNSRVVNSLAAAAFPSYLIHVNLLPYCGIERAVQSSPLLMTAWLIGCVLAVYLVSWLLHSLYQLAARPLFAALDRRWKRHRIYRVE